MVRQEEKPAAPSPAAARATTVARAMQGICEEARAQANAILKEACSKKANTTPSDDPLCADVQCRPVDFPNIWPCFDLRWGDAPADQIETDDVEVLCIVARNPYSNVIFKELVVVLTEVTLGGGPVPTLPDGTASVDVTPSELICFGDLAPCDPEDPAASRVSREVVLVTRGARPGDYVFEIQYCFTVEFVLRHANKFPLTLVLS